MIGMNENTGGNPDNFCRPGDLSKLRWERFKVIDLP
jgi:hypothetical protein